MQRITHEIFHPTLHFVSDDVVTYSSDSKKMEEGDTLYAHIDIDQMMKSYLSYNETLGSKLFFAFTIWALKIEVHCADGKVYKCCAHRDIKSYLRLKYLNNGGFYRKNYLTKTIYLKMFTQCFHCVNQV